MKQITLQQNTPEWLNYRLNGVGASEIPSISGITGAFTNYHAIMMQKLGHVQEISPYLEKIFKDGHEWEIVARDIINDQGYNFVPMVVESDENQRYFASLDGIDLEKKMILEIKSCTTTKKFDSFVKETPKHYYSQVQWQLFVTGLDQAMLAFVHDEKMIVRNITADKDHQLFLKQYADKFLEELDEAKVKGLQPVQQIMNPDIHRIVKLKQIEAQMKFQLEKIDEEIKTLAERNLREFGATKIENDLLSIQTVEREGSVDYKKIPELQNIDLNKYRKKGTSYLKITLK